MQAIQARQRTSVSSTIPKQTRTRTTSFASNDYDEGTPQKELSGKKHQTQTLTLDIDPVESLNPKIKGIDALPSKKQNSIDARLVKTGICMKKECLISGASGNPHRHQTAGCKDHPFCIDDPIRESVPIFSTVPMPFPITGSEFSSSTIQKFLQGVDQGKFGETGPQLPGTRTLPTQYSLDHYWVQQWGLDIDQMPGNLPDKWEKVQKMFQNYSRRAIPKKVKKAGGKPTLQKKLAQWEQAKLEIKKRELEHQYWQSNQDPKIYALLESNGKKKDKNKSKRGKSSTPLLGKYTDPAKFKLDSPGDQIPITYSSTQKLIPVFIQLDKEHDEIVKMQNQNPGARFTDLTEQYYTRRKEREQEEFKKIIMGMRSIAAPESYLPTPAAKKRMDSDPLNSWMPRDDIQETAERFEEFKQQICRMNPEQLQKLQSQNSRQSSPVQKPLHIRTVPITTSSRHKNAINKLNALTQGRDTPKKPIFMEMQFDSQKMQMHEFVTKNKHDYQSAFNKAKSSQNRPLSTSASTVQKHNRKGGSSSVLRQRARLFSAKPEILSDQPQKVSSITSMKLVCSPQQSGF